MAPDPPARVVRVKVLVDAKLREIDPNWKQGTGGLIEAASDYFQREFGIQLVARKIVPWPLEEKNLSTAALLVRLKEKVPLQDEDGSYDVIIGLTGERLNIYAGRGRVDRIGDCREGLGNYLITSVSTPFRYSGLYDEPTLDLVGLLHELGHIFGAEHVRDPNSIMNENFDYRAAFDEKNRQIILKNRLCPFGR